MEWQLELREVKSRVQSHMITNSLILSSIGPSVSPLQKAQQEEANCH